MASTIAPDFKLYICNAISHLQLLPKDIIDPSSLFSADEVTYCVENSFSYLRGPAYALVLVVSKLLGSDWIYEKVIPISCAAGMTVSFNAIHKIIFKKNPSIKRLLIFILSPTFLWLSIFPSTDMPCALFTTLAILVMCQFWKEQNSKYLHHKTCEAKSKKKSNYLQLVIFILFLFAGLLFRPSLITMTPLTIVFLYIFTRSVPRTGIFQRALVFLLPITLLIITYIFLYGNYGGNSFDYFFHSYTPPAPEGLWEISKSYRLAIAQNSDSAFSMITSLVGLIFSSVYGVVFGFISVSGIQTSSDLSHPNIHMIASSAKLVYALLIFIPGMYGMFNKSFYIASNARKIIMSSRKINFGSTYYLLGLLSFAASLSTIGFIITLPHSRYMLPIHSIIIFNSFDQFAMHGLQRKKLDNSFLASGD